MYSYLCHISMYLYNNFSADLTECESMSMINPDKNHYLTPIIPIRRASSQGHLASEEAKIAVEAEVCMFADFDTLSHPCFLFSSGLSGQLVSPVQRKSW
jgi:hypothetical protein